uniref:Transporter n=2 Tax=Aromatoleum toluolicum TaxID=90060 RepID=A0ABX1NJN2_9RHOO|nr:transporter [Aromatoleum toluolicum]
MLGRSRNHSGVWQTTLAAGAAWAMLSMHAHAADVLPGAYTALPADKNVFQLFYTHTERNKQYVDGHSRPIAARVDSDIFQLRYHHFMEMGGYIVNPNIIIPYGQLEGKRDLSAFGKSEGLGDVVLNATIWLHNDPKARTYFGITPYLFLPTGEYDNKERLNLGENRWKFALQGGYTTAISDNILFDLTGDVTVYGKNNDFGAASAKLEQDESYQVQTYLRYKFSPSFEANIGLSHVWGGETEINGVKQRNELRTTKYLVGAAYFFRPTTQLLALFSRDTAVENGLKESGKLVVRFTQVF